MTILLRKMRASERSIVERFSVTGAQSAFVEPLNAALASLEPRINFVIEHDNVPIGFFQIDASSNSQCVADHLELHEVSIDRPQQGRGFGKAFVETLPAFLQKEFPSWQGVCLTVNCKNLEAKRLYELGGFIDTGEFKKEGRSGPQHIMRRCLFNK